MTSAVSIRAEQFSVDNYVRLNFTALNFDELDQWLGDRSFVHASSIVKLAICKAMKKPRVQGDPLPMRLNLMELDVSTRLPKIAEETVVDAGERDIRRSGLERVGRFRVTNFPAPLLFTAAVDPDKQVYVGHNCWPVKSHFEFSWIVLTVFNNGHELQTTSGKPLNEVGNPEWRTWQYEKENNLPVVLNTHRKQAARIAAAHGGVAELEPTLKAYETTIQKSWERWVQFGLERNILKPTKA